MWTAVVGFIAAVAVLTLLAYGVGRLLSRYIEKEITERLSAMEQIINEHQVPVAWIRPYQLRAARLKEAGATERHLAQLARVAQKHCLANIKALIRYVEKTELTDTEATRRLVLAALREEEKQWQDDTVWNERVDLSAYAEELDRG